MSSVIWMTLSLYWTPQIPSPHYHLCCLITDPLFFPADTFIWKTRSHLQSQPEFLQGHQSRLSKSFWFCAAEDWNHCSNSKPWYRHTTFRNSLQSLHILTVLLLTLYKNWFIHLSVIFAADCPSPDADYWTSPHYRLSLWRFFFFWFTKCIFLLRVLQQMLTILKNMTEDIWRSFFKRFSFSIFIDILKLYIFFLVAMTFTASP